MIVGIVRVPAHVLIVAVGGGVEWAFWDNWSAKVEYDFYDFSTRNIMARDDFWYP
jgi:opacity protein-like surface antigen